MDAVLVGVDEGAFGDGGLDDRLDRFLPHVGKHAQDHLPAPGRAWFGFPRLDRFIGEPDRQAPALA